MFIETTFITLRDPAFCLILKKGLPLLAINGNYLHMYGGAQYMARLTHQKKIIPWFVAIDSVLQC